MELERGYKPYLSDEIRFFSAMFELYHPPNFRL